MFFSLAYFIVGVHYIIHITCKICVNQLFVISKFSVNSTLLVNLGGVKSKMQIFNCIGGLSTPDPHVVQGSTIHVAVPDSVVKNSKDSVSVN